MEKFINLCNKSYSDIIDPMVLSNHDCDEYGDILNNALQESFQLGMQAGAKTQAILLLGGYGRGESHE